MVILMIEVKITAFYCFCKVMLQDPLDDNVIPIAQELQRRLSSIKPSICQQPLAEEEEHLGQPNDLENSEENGIAPPYVVVLINLLFLNTPIEIKFIQDSPSSLQLNISFIPK